MIDRNLLMGFQHDAVIVLEALKTTPDEYLFKNLLPNIFQFCGKDKDFHKRRKRIKETKWERAKDVWPGRWNDESKKLAACPDKATRTGYHARVGNWIFIVT